MKKLTDAQLDAFEFAQATMQSLGLWEDDEYLSSISSLVAEVREGRLQMATIVAESKTSAALLRESLEAIAECVNEPHCNDVDEPLDRKDWCEWCRLVARIEEHLARREVGEGEETFDEDL